MAKRLNLPRVAAPINPRLEKNLAAYMAVGAAGLALSVAAVPAEGKIVYTATNTTITGPTNIDLNNDKIADFTIGLHYYFGLHSTRLLLKPDVAGNAVRCIVSAGTLKKCIDASVGVTNEPVSQGDKFVASSGYPNGIFMANFIAYGSKTYFLGPWAKAKNRYLGLKFMIAGQIHYGWARLTVQNWGKGGKVVLTGYAYETTPNMGILEGRTSGPSEASSLGLGGMIELPQSSSLGLLALGADGLTAWRREDELKAA